MNTQDKRRVLASASAIMAMPFFFVCGVSHFCMGGHMAHPSYPWYHFVNEFGWLTFLVIALVFAFRSNIQARKTFIFLIVLMLALRILGEGMLTLFMAAGLIVASVRGLRNKKPKDIPTTTSTLSSEGAPSDDKVIYKLCQKSNENRCCQSAHIVLHMHHDSV